MNKSNGIIIGCILLILLLAQCTHSIGLTARQIVERASRPYDAILDYTVDAKLSIQSENMHVPSMDVTIIYKKPDKVRIIGKDGFAVLPKQGLIIGNPLREITSGAKLSIQGSQVVQGLDCYVILATATRDEEKVETRIWIDKHDFLPRQIVSNPEFGSSMKINITYTKASGKYWLPKSTSARVLMQPIRLHPQRSSSAPTLIKIVFSNYRVNTGLSDKTFSKN